ncbi:MAG: glucosamine-6-phosphate deaminase [Eubacteriales bacterium]
MILEIYRTPEESGARAAARIADKLREAISLRGEARLLLSTGASQFKMFDSLCTLDIDWSRVVMFHLDEYVALSGDHIASFRRYLRERFESKLPMPLKSAHYVDGEGDIAANIERLTSLFCAAPIDVGAIGIGENGHIAFNDPPADFETDKTYITVKLDDRCKAQQVREGWFDSIAEVPAQAVSMTVRAIMSCRSLVSVVPGAVKADAVRKTLGGAVAPDIPAAILKRHADWALYLDFASAAGFFNDSGI